MDLLPGHAIPAGHAIPEARHWPGCCSVIALSTVGAGAGAVNLVRNSNGCTGVRVHKTDRRKCGRLPYSCWLVGQHFYFQASSASTSPPTAVAEAEGQGASKG